MDFVTALLILTNWKGDSYDLILVVVNLLIKMIHYKLVKVTIDVLRLNEVIIDVIVRHHELLDSIVTKWGLLLTSKFWLLLCYFLGIKKKLSIAFHAKIDGQIKRQNSTMEAYLMVFINFKQNDWARLLPMAEFAYNNSMNARTGYTPFKFNCR